MNDVRKSIGWADATWNPVTGCSPISEGCQNCYAAAISKRFGLPWGSPAFHPERLDEPLRRKKPAVIFPCSMADLFHQDVPDQWIDQVFAVMALCPQHTFLTLTKRPERMAKYMAGGKEGSIDLWGDRWPRAMDIICGDSEPTVYPLPNLWLGVTAENQEQADKRIPILMNTPAAVRFVSVEPMLSPVDLRIGPYPPCGHHGCYNHVSHPCEGCGRIQGVLPIDWVICGGESGPGARPIHPNWVRDLRDQCQAADVPFFFKQWGTNPDDEAYGEPFGKVCARMEFPRAGSFLDGWIWKQFPKTD